MLASGTVRGRIGYAPGSWLFYATGGFAWTYNQQTLTNLATGTSEIAVCLASGLGGRRRRRGADRAALDGAARISVHRLRQQNLSRSRGAQPFTSDFPLQEVRAGVNYQFNNDAVPASAPLVTKATAARRPRQRQFPRPGYVRVARLPRHSARHFMGPNSLQPAGNGRETIDATLFAGLRLWKGAELWVDPEIDQGHGLAETHGVAGFASGESYKLGFDYPYARVQRYFIRQTIDLGGETQKVDADINQFAGSLTENRLVLWVGKFAVVDIFDTNKYANNPKTDFLNWSLINAGTFDYAGDAWGYTYGAAAEWYQGLFTFRGGVFDMSATPAGGGMNAAPTVSMKAFNQHQYVGEIEERHELWGQPGKLKITGFLIHGRMGDFQDAVALAATRASRLPATPAMRLRQCAPTGTGPASASTSSSKSTTDRRVRPRRLGRRQRRAVGFHRHRPHRVRRVSPSPASIGAGLTTRSALPASSTVLLPPTSPISTPAAWAFWSVTARCRIMGSSRSSRPITATLSPPR